MIFRQLYDLESSTYTYLLADEQSKEAIIIDSVKENLERDLQLIRELGLKLLYSLETHIHADHITATRDISKATGAQTVAPATAKVPCADMNIQDADELQFGAHTLRAIYTPGHTDTCMSYLVGDKLFSGDALFIRGTGRTDFQSGSSKALYESITQKLYSLPDETLVYPGHDYKGRMFTSIGEEKNYNPRINANTSEAEFIKTMSELKLANPKKIHEAVPANLQCGQIAVADLKTDKDAVLIDVRSEDEHKSGCIPGAICIPHDELESKLHLIPKDKEVVLFCRSGKRSALAKAKLVNLGYQNVSDIEGGFLAWAASAKPVEKKRQAISLQRQVMIVAGTLVALGAFLGFFLRPEFYALSAFVGVGLAFAGFSGFCGMALLLEKMPWNKELGASGGTCSI